MIDRDRAKRYWWFWSGAVAALTLGVGLALAPRLGGMLPRASAAALVDEKGTGGASSPGVAGKVAPDRVKALAKLAPVSGLIAVGVRPGQRIARINVKEGDDLGEGRVVAILEGRREAEEQLAIAEATKRAADWKRGLRKRALEVERAATDQTRALQLEAAKLSAKLTKNKFDASSTLFKTFGSGLKGKELYDAEGALFQLELGQIKTKLDQSLLEAAAQAEKEKRAIEDEHLADRSPENDVLNGQIALAKLAVDETEVRSSRAGKVLRLLAHEGEVSQGAVLEIGDVTSMVAEAEVYETDAVGIKLGDSAEVSLFDTKVAGKVTKVSRVVGRNQMTSIDPRALRDLRVVLVTIELTDAEPASRFVNMEVEATISPSGVGLRQRGQEPSADQP